MKRRNLNIFLLAMILANTTAGCGGADTPASDTTVPPDSGDVTAVEAKPEIRDDLPADLDFGGETVRFLYREELLNEFYSEEETGDVVDAAVYNSMLAVEERLNVDIVVEALAGHMNSERDNYINHVSNSVMAGDDMYDWVDMLAGRIPQCLPKGIFADILENKYVNIEKPWYLQGFSDMAIDGKLFFISGDASLGYMKNAFVIYFNTDLVDDYHLDNLYTLVDEGKWTLDKMGEIAAISSQDVNGDGAYDGNDKLGFLVHNYNHLVGFYGSTGTKMYERETDGSFSLTFGSERDADVCDKLFRVLYGSVGTFDCNLSDTTDSEVAPFMELTNKFIAGDILMMTAQMDEAIQYLRNMQSPYGILPFPKYDEAQAEYITLSRSQHNAFVMPLTCDVPDNVRY
ncbi:MAG: hypothetical protein E7632_08020, partial [Ruminococcaceae bacterium]|nr:hypothetical protein [Oscillospiraceae bacterium]